MKGELTVVAASQDMDKVTLRKHIEARHPNLRFASRGEHAAQHRLQPSTLGHVHEEACEHGDYDVSEPWQEGTSTVRHCACRVCPAMWEVVATP